MAVIIKLAKTAAAKVRVLVTTISWFECRAKNDHADVVFIACVFVSNRFLYVASLGDEEIRIYSRNPKDNSLTFVNVM